jgi:hypothetical protein
MRTFLSIAGVLAVFAAVACTMVSGRDEHVSPKAAASNGVAVVELFTSEGCSSCPPADELLGKLVANSRAKDAPESARRVYALAFHVDYWDRLGWRDRFSNAAFSERQRQYASAAKSDRIYTPQMIVNGTTEFVGSDAGAAKRAIAEAQSHAADVEVKLSRTVSNPDNAYAVAYDIDDVSRLPEGAVLNVALVERGLETAVKNGENGGRTLKHDNVARWFTTVAPKKHDVVHIPLSDDLRRENASIVAYVQQKGPGRVLGATALDLP